MSIQVEKISKCYGAQKALNNVSFEVKKGEIVGFLGPNGAGKSTMMKILTGYIPQSEGTVKVNFPLVIPLFVTPFEYASPVPVICDVLIQKGLLGEFTSNS